MGYIRHHAIVVTDHGYGNALDQAHEAAQTLHPVVSPIIDGTVNAVRSFAVLPDGSKEFWDDSDTADTARDLFIAFLRTLVYEDGSSPLSWVHLQYGDDNLDTRILESSDADHAALIAKLAGGAPTQEGAT